MIKINIPVKPLSINKAFQGRRFKTKDYNDFTRDVCYTLPVAKKTITKECSIDYTFYVSNYKMVDVDNCIKTCQDLIVLLNYLKDDRLIVELCARKKSAKLDRKHKKK